MKYKYIVIDESDAYRTSVRKYETAEKMLDGVQHSDIDKIEVYEIGKRVILVRRPSIVLEDL